jgi:aminodeoxyfutalosine synthase
MAGSEEQTPSLSTAQLVTLIRQAGREPVERDTLYNEIRNYKDVDLDKTDLDDIQMDASLN